MIIAETILKQIGGNKFVTMTGSYNLAAGENYLQMSLRRNNLKAKFLIIRLNSMDTYDMEFKSINRNYDIKEIETVNGVYGEDLARIFESKTGLYTSL